MTVAVPQVTVDPLVIKIVLLRQVRATVALEQVATFVPQEVQAPELRKYEAAQVVQVVVVPLTVQAVQLFPHD